MSRIRTNLITNRMANGAPTVSHGLVVAGVTTITTLDLNGDLDVDGHLNADNVSIAGVVTATTFSGSGASLTNLNGSNIASGTVPVARIGTGTKNNTTFYRGDGTFQVVNTDLVSDTSPQLGANLDVNGANILFGDSSAAGTNLNRLKFGAGTDLHIWHNGGTGNSNISAYSGDLYIQGNNGSGTGQNQIAIKSNAAVELNYQGTKKFETTSAGCKVSTGVLDFDDNVEARFGTGNDFKIYFDGTNGVLRGATGSVQNINVWTENTAKYQFTAGAIRPLSNNSYDLGDNALRWRNVYTNDLNLSNKGSANSIDNTWGDYTIQEGESDLFLINNRSGKKYKFNLTEVN